MFFWNLDANKNAMRANANSKPIGRPTAHGKQHSQDATSKRATRQQQELSSIVLLRSNIPNPTPEHQDR